MDTAKCNSAQPELKTKPVTCVLTKAAWILHLQLTQ